MVTYRITIEAARDDVRVQDVRASRMSVSDNALVFYEGDVIAFYVPISRVVSVQRLEDTTFPGAINLHVYGSPV